MKCRRHPDTERLPRRSYCTFCEDWSAGAEYVGQDQLWNFTTTGWHPKLPAGLRINSQAHWQRCLKRHGVTDDLSLKERIRRRECGIREKAWEAQRQQMRQRLGGLLRQALDASRRITTSGR